MKIIEARLEVLLTIIILDLFIPNLGKSGGYFYPPCWFLFNNSKTVKVINLTFCRIKELFVRNIFAKFDIPNLPKFTDISRNPERDISNFCISGQSLLSKNCPNYIIINDIHIIDQ